MRIIDPYKPEDDRNLAGGDRLLRAVDLKRSHDLDIVLDLLPELQDRNTVPTFLQQTTHVLDSASDAAKKHLGRTDMEIVEDLVGQLGAMTPDVFKTYRHAALPEVSLTGTTNNATDGLKMVRDAIVWRKLAEAKGAGHAEETYVNYLRQLMTPSMRFIATSAVNEGDITPEMWQQAVETPTRTERKGKGRKVALGIGAATTAFVVAANIANSFGFLPKKGSEDTHTSGRVPAAAAPLVPSPSSTATPELPGYSPPTASAQEIASLERVKDGICLSGATKKLLKSDCITLGNILDGAKFEFYDGMKVVGTIGPNGRYDKAFSDLPPSYQKAFVEMINHDELVKHANEKVPIFIAQTSFENDPDNSENGEFTSNHGGSITYRFSTDREEKHDNLYPTWGAVRLVGEHEATHYVIDKWLKEAKTDPITEANMKAMSEACVADLRDISTKIYTEKRTDMLAAIQKLHEHDEWVRSTLSKSESETYFKRLNMLEGALTSDSPTLYMALTVTESGDGRCSSLTPRELLDNPEYSEEKQAAFERNLGYQKALSALNVPPLTVLQKEFAFTTEGNLLDKLISPSAGHPYGLNVALTERAASTTALARTAPEQYITAIRKLPKERQVYELQFLTALAGQFKHEGLEGVYLDLTYVQAGIREK